MVLLLLRIVSSLGDERDEMLPSDVPLRLRAATDRLSDSSMLAICGRVRGSDRLAVCEIKMCLTLASNVASVAILGFGLGCCTA